MDEEEDGSLVDKLNYIDDSNIGQSQSQPKFRVTQRILNFAKKEEKSYSQQRADVYGKQGIRLDRTLFRIASVFIWILAILFMLLILIWFFHLVSPECLKWLSKADIQSIERILLASTILSIAGKYFSKYKILEKHD